MPALFLNSCVGARPSPVNHPPSLGTLRIFFCDPLKRRQDPEDRTAFFMLQRFPSPEAMSSYQNTDTFQTFTDVRLFVVWVGISLLYLVVTTDRQTGRQADSVVIYARI